jgi:hypothetical protein
MAERFVVPVDRWQFYPRLTAAMLTAEEVTERWCCPRCGGLNASVPECRESYAGWCQHAACVDRRCADRLMGNIPIPELTFPAYQFDKRPKVYA